MFERRKQDLMGIYLLIVNAFIYLPGAAFSPFMSAFYSKNGIDPVLIGILFAVSPICAICIQPLWAMFSDHTGKRRQVFLAVVAGCIVSPLLYYLDHTFQTFLIATLAYAVFAPALVPLSDAIMLQNCIKYQLEFSRIRMGGTIGYALVVLLAGSYLKVNPNAQFVMGAIGYVLLFLICLKLPAGIGVDQQRIASEPDKSDKKDKRVFKDKRIIFVLLFALVGQIGLSFHGAFMGVYVMDIGYSQNAIGILNSISAFSEIPILFLINRLIRKYGSMKILIFSCIMVGVRMFMVTIGGMPVLVAAQLLHGVTYMTTYYSCAIFINDNVLPGKHSRGQSMLAMLQAGVGSILGSVAGGYLVNLMGLQITYRMISVFIIGSAVGIIVMHRNFNKKKRLGTIATE